MSSLRRLHIKEGIVTEVLNRDSDFHIRYKTDAAAKHGNVMCISKREAVNPDVIANAAGKPIKVYLSGATTIIAAAIDGKAVVEREPYKISDPAAERPGFLARLLSSSVMLPQP